MSAAPAPILPRTDRMAALHAALRAPVLLPDGAMGPTNQLPQPTQTDFPLDPPPHPPHHPPCYHATPVHPPPRPPPGTPPRGPYTTPAYPTG